MNVEALTGGAQVLDILELERLRLGYNQRAWYRMANLDEHARAQLARATEVPADLVRDAARLIETDLHSLTDTERRHALQVETSTALARSVMRTLEMRGHGEMLAQARQIVGQRALLYLLGRFDMHEPDGMRIDKLEQAQLKLTAVIDAGRELQPLSIAQSWMQGMNPTFGDRAPLRVLRYAEDRATVEAVASMARVYAHT